MLLKYLDQDGEELASAEVKFMPHVGDTVDLGDNGSYQVEEVSRDNTRQEASVYLK